MVLDTNLYFYSPYPTTSQTTTVTTTNANVESYTKTKPVSQSDTTINYGPFEDKAPFSEVLFSHNVNTSKSLLSLRYYSLRMLIVIINLSFL